MSQTISVIVPTVTPRKKWLEACVAAYEKTTPNVQIIVVRNEKSCGIAWQKGARKAKGDFIHFTADDLVPLPGWWQAAVAVSNRGAIPAANVLDKGRNGRWDPNSTMRTLAYLHGDRMTANILVPFFSRALFDRDPEWLLPIHYGSDDWVTFLADRLDIPTPFVKDYRFGHGAAPEGRLFDSRRIDIPILCDRMEARGGTPGPYVALGIAHGWAAPPGAGRPRRPDRNRRPPRRPGIQPAPKAAFQDPGFVWNGPVRARA